MYVHRTSSKVLELCLAFINFCFQVAGIWKWLPADNLETIVASSFWSADQPQGDGSCAEWKMGENVFKLFHVQPDENMFARRACFDKQFILEIHHSERCMCMTRMFFFLFV